MNKNFEHFDELIEPTPISMEKLLSVWDDLTIETQVLILHKLKQTSHPKYLLKKVYLKAFDSTNPFIRYLAIRPRRYPEQNLSTLLDTKEFEQKIKDISGKNYSLIDQRGRKFNTDGDVSKLVKYSNIGYVDTIDEFYDLPHGAKLEATCNWGSADDDVFSIIEALPNKINENRISIDESIEILENYFCSERFRDIYINKIPLDGYASYLFDEERDRLWRLLLKFPSTLHLPLIQHLPGDLFHDIPNEVAQAISGDSLKYLLMRDDLNLGNIRREIFFDKTKNEYYFHAVSSGFNLSFDEFHSLLPRYRYKKDENHDMTSIEWEAESVEISEKIDSLLYAKEIDWVYLFCLRDYFYSTNWNRRSLNDIKKIDNSLCELYINNKKKGNFSYIKEQIFMLKLYLLASRVSPWQEHEINSTHTLDDDFDFLKGSVNKDDRWKTFMNFVKVWKNGHSASNLERCLPEITNLRTLIDRLCDDPLSIDMAKITCNEKLSCHSVSSDQEKHSGFDIINLNNKLENISAKIRLVTIAVFILLGMLILKGI